MDYDQPKTRKEKKVGKEKKVFNTKTIRAKVANLELHAARVASKKNPS
jgi:hypothetical protein